MTKAGEQDSLPAKEIHLGATLRVEEFSHCLPGAWVTTLAHKVRPSACVAAKAETGGMTGEFAEKRAGEQIVLSDLVFPSSLSSNCSLNFNFQLVKIQNSLNLSAACKRHYATEGGYMQRYYVHAQSL